MNIKIVYVFAPIFFKHERTCLLRRMQNSFSDLVGDQASGTSDRKRQNCAVLLLLTWSAACSLRHKRWRPQTSFPSVTVDRTGNCLFNPTFKDTSGDHRHQLLEASNHVLWNRLPDPVEDLFNRGKALQIYWLRSASVLGSGAWNTMNPMWKKENLCFSFRDLLQPNKCLLLTSLEITQRSLRSCLW